MLRLVPIHLISQVPFAGGFVGLADSLFIFRQDKRCIHDLIAGTKVVEAEQISDQSIEPAGAEAMADKPAESGNRGRGGRSEY